MAEEAVGVPARVNGAADALALAYARRVVLVACQAYSALAASFAASCRLRVAESDHAWFAGVAHRGYLLLLGDLLRHRSTPRTR